ncbi:hypothetical protein [Actinoplanes sp. TFC3]|uniref:hypothetical protein n=1 Tax=Actinoplanes sp. TFC3 TaxID=1710355 RepID=UPI000A85D12B|nr:hypothetical protein [Actinoplanes sp. TFC3]
MRAVLRRHDDGFYSHGWNEVNGPNGDSCLVYCGTVRESGTEWLLDQLREIAVIPAFVHHEVSGMQEWQIRDDRARTWALRLLARMIDRDAIVAADRAGRVGTGARLGVAAVARAVA